MPELPKTAAEFDRQIAARAVRFTAVLAAGRERQRFEFPCTGDTSRYNAFLNATAKASNLSDAYGRRGMVYAVDAAGRDVHLAKEIWPELAVLLRHAAQPHPTHSNAHQPQQQETHMAKAKKHATKPTKKTAATKPTKKIATTKPAKVAAAAATPTGHRPLKTSGVIFVIKKLILENPAITAEDLTAKLVALGFTPSQATIASFRTDFVHSLRVLKSCGYDIPSVQA